MVEMDGRVDATLGSALSSPGHAGNWLDYLPR